MRRTCGKLRMAKKRLRARYAREREDRQLSGEEPTVPTGAVREERAPASPGPPMPDLVRRALREGWDVPDASKPKVVAELIAGAIDPDTATSLRIRLVRTLLLADKVQYARDRAEEAGKGGSLVLNVNIVNVDSDAPDAEHTPLPLPSTVEQLPTLRD